MKPKTKLRRDIEKGTAVMFAVNEPKQSKILLELAHKAAAEKHPILAWRIKRLIRKVGTKAFNEKAQKKASALYHKAILGRGS